MSKKLTTSSLILSIMLFILQVRFAYNQIESGIYYFVYIAGISLILMILTIISLRLFEYKKIQFCLQIVILILSLLVAFLLGRYIYYFIYINLTHHLPSCSSYSNPTLTFLLILWAIFKNIIIIICNYLLIIFSIIQIVQCLKSGIFNKTPEQINARKQKKIDNLNRKIEKLNKD